MRIEIARIILLAEQAGKHVLGKLKSGDFTVRYKKDHSPVTNLDEEAASIIRDGLGDLTPSIPIITEEDKDDASIVRDKLSQPVKWFVDPIDGTKTALGFAEGREEHDGWGIHLGLIEENIPQKGFVYFPARGGGTFYFTCNDGIAYKKNAGENDARKISVKSIPENRPMNVSVSWHKEAHPEKIAGREYIPIHSVGGERVCLVADGSSHLAWLKPSFAPWDIAASHAVLRAANGAIVTLENGGNSLDYSNENLALEPCIAGALSSLRALGYSKK